METGNSFSPTYDVARERFREAAESAGAELRSYGVPVPEHDGPALTMDVAILGSPEPEGTLVLSSGLHGVEGFLGSAVQVAWLENACAESLPADGLRVVLVHAINPYGFQTRRRTNEENVDLNRNFLLGDETYAGAPDGYAQLDSLLNPASPPPRFDLFLPKAIWRIACSGGMRRIKTAVAGGQYEYPEGLFFGGDHPATSTRLVRDHFEEWTGGANQVVHIDLHTGLGKHGQAKLYFVEPPDSANATWYRDTFGERVECVRDTHGSAYSARGTMTGWLSATLGPDRYRAVTAEFGTHGSLRVIQALRADNRARFHTSRDSAARQRASAEMIECFCPALPRWREQVLAGALDIVNQGLAASARG